MPLLRSSMRGKKSGACQRASHDATGPGPFPARQTRAGGSFADIGVAAHLVGMRMVSVVLGNPPAEAQPDERVPHGEAEQAIAPARAEDLVVPRVMADEAQLGERHPHQRGDGEGRPRVAGDDEQGPPAKKAKTVRVIFTR